MKSIVQKRILTFLWIPVFTGMTSSVAVISAEAGIQFFAISQIESLRNNLKLA